VAIGGAVVLLFKVPGGGVAKFCSRLPADVFGSNPAGVIVVCGACSVLSGTGLYNELITRQEEPYGLWCVIMYVLESVKVRKACPVLFRSATGKFRDNF